MFTPLKSDRILKTKGDLARILGLGPNAEAAQIARAFEAQTNFETVLAIKEVKQLVRVNETWEVRITRALPRPKVEMRRGNRGSWVRNAEDVPEEIRRRLLIRTARNGEMETTRSWGAWQRLDWLSNRGRQLRARSGEIHAIIEFEGITRETGMRRTEIRIEPLTDDDMSAPAPIQLSLPCSAKVLSEAVSRMREACLPLAA